MVTDRPHEAIKNSDWYQSFTALSLRGKNCSQLLSPASAVLDKKELQDEVCFFAFVYCFNLQEKPLFTAPAISTITENDTVSR